MIQVEVTANTTVEQLESLVGLEGLHGHVDGAIVIDENAALKSLEGLENVASIDHANVEGDSVQIKNNAQLATVEALGELQSVFGSINVQGKASCPQYGTHVESIDPEHKRSCPR